MKTIKQIIKYILFYINLNLKFSIKNLNKEDFSKNILIIKNDNIGDFIIWLWEAPKYKEYFKKYKISIIVNKSFYQLTKELNLFHEVICLDNKKFNLNFFYKKNFIKKMREKKYDKIIVPMYSRTLITETLILHLIAKEKIGMKGDTSNLSSKLLQISDKFYTKLVDTDDILKMELYKNLKFSNVIFNQDKKIERPCLLIDDGSEKSEDNKIEITEKFCIFFMGSSVKKKCWELEKFLEIGEKLGKEYKILLFGGKLEEKLGKKYIEKSANKENVYNFIGKLSLVEVIKYIKKAQFIISNDTFSVHLAALLNVNVICIGGGGHFGRFFPYPREVMTKSKFITVYKKMDCYNCNWKCRYIEFFKPWRCVSKIEPKDVLKKINEELIKRDK